MLIRVLTSVAVCVALIFIVSRSTNTSTAPSLQSVATSALNGKDGTIVVLNAQTGEIQAAINPDLAQRAFPPGSTIKPFTALTALRNGVIDENTRMRCRYDQKHNETVEVCSHPRNLPPLNLSEALAHSCNHYFANTGERLDADALAQTLTQFGFASINRAKWEPHSAIGEGEFVQVTPLQLLRAYTALFNGGKLFHSDSAPTQIQISAAERAALLDGLRGAVKFGTADKTDLKTGSNYVIGKTGTATHLQGFRAQGWFVGLAFAPNKPPEPQNAQRAVIVYVKKGHGSDAAAIAAPILKLPLEDYVARVVAAEGSIDNQRESLKALAVAVRTYALKNLGRHKHEGYDFCSSTHCQRFDFTATAPLATAVQAAYDTAGLILKDSHGQLAESYFSASCGGMTANLQSLWGASAPPHLSGVRDDFCNAGSHARWTDKITLPRMLKALRSDPRTNVGENIRELTVAKRDQTGRAELVSIVGAQKRVVNGWDFKLIVGRALGWNVLKSSRFTVSRSGSDFVFRGTGFGHGLGLCQEGAHEMAQRGYNFSQILAKYYPTTSVGPQTAQSNRTRSAHFTLSATTKLDPREAEQLLGLLESNRSALARRLSTAGVEFQFPDVEIFINSTTGDFVGRTGMPPWAAAATRRNRIELQPLALLKQRRILETTLRHELVHVVIDALGGNQTPRWLAEGLALHLAGEGKLLAQPGKGPLLAPKELEQKLANAKTAAEMKQAYAAAYQTVRDLLRVEGENKLWQRVASRSYDVSARMR